MLRVEQETEERNSEDVSATCGAIVVGIANGDMVQHTGPVELVSAPSNKQVGGFEVFHTDRACISMKWLRHRFGQLSVGARRHFFVVRGEESDGCNVKCSLGSGTMNGFYRPDSGNRRAVSRRRGIHNIRTDHSLRRAWWGNDIDTGTHAIGLIVEHKLG